MNKSARILPSKNDALLDKHKWPISKHFFTVPGGESFAQESVWNFYQGYALPDPTFTNVYDIEEAEDAENAIGPYHSDVKGYFPESDPLSQRSDSQKSSCLGSLNGDEDKASSHDDATVNIIVLKWDCFIPVSLLKVFGHSIHILKSIRALQNDTMIIMFVCYKTFTPIKYFININSNDLQPQNTSQNLYMA